MNSTYTVAEELSEDGGPFVHLGNAVVTKSETRLAAYRTVNKRGL